MEADLADALVAEILADTEVDRALVEARRLEETAPAEAAALLERVASAAAAEQRARASRWLTEAAALWAGRAGDPKRAARTLRMAIAIAPEDGEALDRLVALYRDNDQHEALARTLERHGEALLAEARGDAAVIKLAAEAFTRLGDLLRDPPIARADLAIAAYNRAVASGEAGAATFRAARALYAEAGQHADAIRLFALERAQAGDPARRIELSREEAAARRRAGDGPGATEALRAAHRADGEAGLLAEVARSILDRLDDGEAVPAKECAEAAEVFAAEAIASRSDEAWIGAERTFAAAERWEEAAWAAEGRQDWGRALSLLGHAAPKESSARLRVALRAGHLLCDRLNDEKRATIRYEAALSDLRPGMDASTILQILGAPRGAAGAPEDVAARIEEAALRAGHLGALKVAFELSARCQEGAARAAELVRQADVLVGLGAERALAVKHAEVGLAGLLAAEALPLLDRLSRLSRPDHAVDPFERWLARAGHGKTADDHAAIVDQVLPAALKRCPTDRAARLFAVVIARYPDQVDLIETITAERDRERDGAALMKALAGALSQADPGAKDGGRAQSAMQRRAARIARRLGDADQAFAWMGDALFTRLEGALAPLEERAAELSRLSEELRGILDRERRAEAKGAEVKPEAKGAVLRDPFPPPSEPPPSRRALGEELIADLFELMHGLDFCKDSIEAAAFVLKLALGKLGSAAGMVHLYDIDRRAFVIVHAAGPGAEALRGLRTGEGEPLIAEAMRTRAALMLPDGAEDPRASGQRFTILKAAAPGPIHAVACARVMEAGRFLGLIEIVGMGSDPPFAAGDEHALAYIADRYADFVSACGVTFEPG